MSKYHFYRDALYTIWERESFTVEANSQEEAEKIAMEQLNGLTDDIGVDYELLYDTLEEYDTSHKVQEEIYTYDGRLLTNNLDK